MNRTLQRWLRFYMDGYDISGNARGIGELGWEYSEDDQTAIVDAVRSALPNRPTLSLGQLNGLYDTTATSGLHNIASVPPVARKIMIPVGMGVAPVVGDNVFLGEFTQLGYKDDISEDSIAVNIPFGKGTPALLNYEQPWGKLLHAIGSETGANTATGGVDNGGASALGGYLMYQIFSITGTGTITLSIDDSEDDTTYGALSGATSGAIATASAPCAGIVQLSKTATVKQYLRWQLAKGGSATACSFALAFVRGDR